ncbi:inositol 2-dehydrogenase [Pullulanibacillus camelliae]|uniref:Inositol 2-dehydrogenase n=1 Tax=Pullulanibacillus camelliae TaxID=1707096 RepID=A0A8J2YE40_9BACL|nr:Gfo/Idh/MocA family oxidoreductase [Pullulanibacillus camelliae]GGE27575.1 inositol 2-dehydrogenase [Pullulanibacillus camelliae]
MIHAHNYNHQIEQAELVAVCDPNEAAAKKAANLLKLTTYYTTYQEALSNDTIDAVIIACPTKFHKDIAVAAANAKKHIFCEKPMAMNTEECDEMIEAAERNHVKLQIGFMRRFDESFQTAKEMVDAGEVGDVVLVKSLTRGPSKPQEWMYDISISNGPLGEVNSHDIDTMRWFSGSEFKTLFAVGGNFRNKEVKDRYPDFYDNVVMNGVFENGVLGSLDGAQYVQYGYDARVEILGTEGIITIGDIHETTVLSCAKNHSVKRPARKSWTNLFKDAYLAEAVSFVKCILNDTLPKATGMDGKMAVHIVDKGNESLKTGTVIQLGEGIH